VCYDGETLASDSRLVSGYICNVTTPKFYKVGSTYVAFCGDAESELVYFRWFKDQTKPKPSPDNLKEFEAMIIRPNGKVYQSASLCQFVEVGKPYAIGSGGSYAMGAMLAGATAKEAVKIAMKLDVDTGGKIKSMRVK
jgi:ATP-dependent protease HslVU (ClpYQ) peptidase subunit